MKLEIAVEIKSPDVREKRGVSKQGAPYSIREQSGYVDVGKAYPVEIRLALEQTAPPYAPGRYHVDPNCLYVDRYGNLALGRIKLVPHG